MKKTPALPKPKDLIIHPLIFALFPILTLYFQNMGKGYLRQAAVIAAGILVFAILAWLLLFLLLQKRDRPASMVSAPAPCTYLSPSTSSYIFQILVAAIEGSGLLLKVYWWKIKGFFTGHSSRVAAAAKDDESA